MNFTTSKKIFSKNFWSEEDKLKWEKEALAAKAFLRMNRSRRQIVSPLPWKVKIAKFQTNLPWASCWWGTRWYLVILGGTWWYLVVLCDTQPARIQSDLFIGLFQTGMTSVQWTWAWRFFWANFFNACLWVYSHSWYMYFMFHTQQIGFIYLHIFSHWQKFRYFHRRAKMGLLWSQFWWIHQSLLLTTG